MSTLRTKNLSKSARLIVWILFIVFWMLTIVQPVKAQSLTLSILPATATITLNGTNSVTLQVQVQNVVDLMGFDITFTYDPAILKLASWEHGSFLSALYGYRNINDPGYLRLAFSQNGVPAVSGSGTLLKLTFSGKSYGTSAITISNAEFGKPAGATFYPEKIHGRITTIFDPSITSNGAVAGMFSLQGQTTTGGVPVTLDDGQFLDRGPFSEVSLNQVGSNLTINPVVMDLYTITTTQPRYLNIDAGCGKTKAVFGTTTTLSPLKLKGGNAVWTDNEINMQDISKVLGVYGEASTLSTPLEADINFNGKVDVYDLAMVAGNYGLTCATAYANWIP